jgi:hypothetical protein
LPESLSCFLQADQRDVFAVVVAEFVASSWKGEVGGGLSAGGDELTEPPQSPQSTAEDVQRPAFTMAIAELAADRECWPLRRSLSDRWTLDLRSER